jgi:translocation and assembly module TamB
MPPSPPETFRAPLRRLDLGRLVARVFCLLFAVIGSLPLGGGVLARTETARTWAATETARVLRQELGVEAEYGVELSFWPFELALTNVQVPASDGGSPAFEASRMAVTPRIFALLAGRLDIGDIEVVAPRGRIVIRDGALTNVAYRLPKSDGPPPEVDLARAPFGSIAITDGRVELEVDELQLLAEAIDLDVLANAGGVEVALRAGESQVRYRRSLSVASDALDLARPDEDALVAGSLAPFPAAEVVALDEDILCQLDLRVRIEGDGGLVRRLSLLGAMDDDPAEGTRPSCAATEDDARRVALRLSQVRVRFDEDYKPLLIDGHVVAKAPAGISGRFGIEPFGGWVGLAGQVHYTDKQELPDFRGRVRGGGFTLGPYVLSERFDGDVEIADDVIHVRQMTAQYGHGTAEITGVRLEPFADGLPLRVERVEGTGVKWEDFMENIDVTKDTIVQWEIDRTLVTKFGGTLDPVKLDGDLYAETRDFGVFDRAYHRSDRQRIIGVAAAALRGRLAVRPTAVQFMNVHAAFGKSAVDASVSIGFDTSLWLDVAPGSTIELQDISPLVDIEMSGRATLSAKMAGIASEAELRGELAVSDLVFGGFPIGDVERSKVSFQGLKVDLSEVEGKKGQSTFVVPSARLDFDEGATLRVDALVESEAMELRDFFPMWHFDEDPRFADIAGTTAVSARIHYDMGGPKDRCGTGYLRVDGKVDSTGLDLFEERYDRASGAFDFRWFDTEAGHLGMQLDVPHFVLGKGPGAVLGNVLLTEGGVLKGHVTASGIPLSRFSAFGDLGRRLDARVSAVGDVGGTLDAMSARVDVSMSPTRIGRRTLPRSNLTVVLEPRVQSPKVVGETACGRPKLAEFDPVAYAEDPSAGVFRLDGSLFGGEIALKDVRVTRQRDKVVTGEVAFDKLDLGAFAELSPTLALSGNRREGEVTATITVDELALAHPGRARASVALERLSFVQDGMGVELDHPAIVRVAEARADLSAMALSVTTPGGHRGTFDVRAMVDKLDRIPVVDASLVLRETDLSRFRALVPRADRLEGKVTGSLRLTGPVSDLVHEGRFELAGGSLVIRGAPASIDGANVVIELTPDEILLKRAEARVGGGTVRVSGGAALSGMDIGAARAVITARDVDVPAMQGVQTTVDADLDLSYRAPGPGEESRRPRLSGDVRLQAFSYTRKVTMTADITSFGKRGRRTHFDTYDPTLDMIDLDVVIHAVEPMRIDNDLISAQLEIDEPGLVLSGTNQRFGVRGQVSAVKGGLIRLRRSEFEITSGRIRFEDPERIAPRVDVTATTEYVRYADAAGASGDATVGAASSAGGRWVITMRAHGDAENLRVDLSSEPELGQDDIFLLLTLGLTRAELDQAQSASAGQSVALEALGRLSGADQAVTETIPVIDEFRFGSAYSSRTGRTEPTVTIGKRLTQRIRAYVTSGLSESRELRSNLEWRMTPRVSLEGSYDNVNDISSSVLGNLGADVRWRMEFE